MKFIKKLKQKAKQKVFNQIMRGGGPGIQQAHIGKVYSNYFKIIDSIIKNETATRSQIRTLKRFEGMILKIPPLERNKFTIELIDYFPVFYKNAQYGNIKMSDIDFLENKLVPYLEDCKQKESAELFKALQKISGGDMIE